MIDEATGQTIEWSVEDRQRAEKHLASLEDFMASPAYSGYVAAKQHEINTLQGQILDSQVTDIPGVLLLLNLKGQLDTNREALTTFEDARNTLKDRVRQMLEREAELRQQSNQ